MSNRNVDEHGDSDKLDPGPEDPSAALEQLAAEAGTTAITKRSPERPADWKPTPRDPAAEAASQTRGKVAAMLAHTMGPLELLVEESELAQEAELERLMAAAARAERLEEEEAVLTEAALIKAEREADAVDPDVARSARERRTQRLDDHTGKPKRKAKPKPNGHDQAKPEVEAALNDGGLAEAIQALNADYFVSWRGQRCVIARREDDPAVKREKLVFTSQEHFKLFYANHLYPTKRKDKNGEPIKAGLGGLWLTSKDRRTYDQMALLPDQQAPEGVYNLWRGWGIEPKAGDWLTIKDHLLAVICAGDLPSYEYLIRWMAWKLQHPGKRPEVAVVMRGDKGAGKGLAVRSLMRFFGAHALQIFNPRHLTGNFNAHLLDTLLLYVDEAFWAGDKAGEGVLKGLITEPTMPIEPKGVDLFNAVNMLGVIMASNAAWVVPAGPDERRYFVLDVADDRCGDHAYFKRLAAAVEGAEAAAMVHELLAMDLADFEIRAVPQTQGLAEQKLIGGDSVQQWWWACLNRGHIAPGGAAWPLEIHTGELQGSYYAWCREHGDKHPVTDAVLGKKLRKLCPAGYLPTSERRPIGAPSYRVYLIKELVEHRQAFALKLGIEFEHAGWDTDA